MSILEPLITLAAVSLTSLAGLLLASFAAYNMAANPEKELRRCWKASLIGGFILASTQPAYVAGRLMSLDLAYPLITAAGVVALTYGTMLLTEIERKKEGRRKLGAPKALLNPA